MPVLDDYSRTGFGGGKYVNESGKGTYSEPNQVQSLYRSGTGRRPKPKTPDETAYERKTYQLVSPRGTGSWTANSQFYKWEGDLPKFNTSNLPGALQAPSGQYDSNLFDIANLKALRSFNHKDLDLGTAWHERGKTADLVRGIAQTGVEALNAIRKRNGRELLNVLGLDHAEARGRGYVDLYLAYQYGIKPGLLDVQGAVQALSRMKPDQWQIAAKGTHADESVKTGQNGLGSFYPYQYESRLRKSARVVIKATQRPLSREDDLRWALGLDDPASTLWEITPFSFMVDWLLPIGDWLQALNSAKYYTGWQTVGTDFIEETMSASGSSGTVSGFIKCQTSVSKGVYKLKNVRRRVLNGLPLFGLPIKDPKSVDHMAKTLSLLATTMANHGEMTPTIRY